jgi:RNA polymerase primary sigma factor
MMKAYLTGEGISLDPVQAGHVQEDICRFLGERRLAEVFEAELSCRTDSGEPPEEEPQRKEPEEPEGDDDGELTCDEPAFDSHEKDPVACYLKEVSNYPLLSREREIELALAIREGQNDLVEMVVRHAWQEPPIRALHRRVQKLLSREKAFPGVRDKALRLTLSTLERLVQDYPQNRLYPELYRQAGSIQLAIDTAKQEMIKANLRLVLSIARHYRGRGMSFDDLIQEGNIGLLTAVGRFDHTKGNRFSTYATHWIRQSIIRGIYVKTRTIRLPVHFVELRNRFFKVFYELLKELGREPTPQELAQRARLSPEKVQQVMRLSVQPVSLETPIGDDGQRLGDFIEDPGAVSPAKHCSHGELTEGIRQLLATLQPREEEVLRLRFGLEGHAAETLEGIAKTYKVSKERIRQIEKKALGKLRTLKRQGCLVEHVG